MRVKHYINDMDGWYSCPASGECEDDMYRDDITTCTCGANEINNYIEQLEKELEEAREKFKYSEIRKQTAVEIMDWIKINGCSDNGLLRFIKSKLGLEE